jgi:hypothetical protein
MNAAATYDPLRASHGRAGEYLQRAGEAWVAIRYAVDFLPALRRNDLRPPASSHPSAKTSVPPAQSRLMALISAWRRGADTASQPAGKTRASGARTSVVARVVSGLFGNKANKAPATNGDSGDEEEYGWGWEEGTIQNPRPAGYYHGSNSGHGQRKDPG